MGPPTLPAMTSKESPWLTTLSSQQSHVPTAVPPPTEDKQMKAIMALLKKHNETLPPDLQALVSDAAMKEGQEETKQLHSAVAAHGRAKRELQQAQLAHFHLHAAWRGFLTQAVTQWKGYSDQFVEQERQMTERVHKALEQLEQAKDTLAKTQSLAGVEHKEDGMSEDEADKDAKAVNTNAADKIKEGISNLHSSLEALRSSADQMVEDEQKALKRPRLEPKTNDAGPAAPGTAPGFG